MLSFRSFIVLAMAAPALAETRIYQFTGTVIDVFETNNTFGGLNVGDSFVARFTFDPASPDLLPADPSNGRYSAISAFFQVPNRDSTQAGGVLDVTNGAAFDTLTFDSVGSSFEIRALFTGDSTGFSNDSMPNPFPTMNGAREMNVLAIPGEDKFAGTITSAVIVPEPAAICLLSLGFAFMRRCR